MPRSVRRLSLFILTLGSLAAVLAAQAQPGSAAKQADAARAFLATLDDAGKKKAHFAFDDPNRTAWFFTPQQDKDRKPLRKGLRFEEMTDKQKDAAMALLKSGLSTKGAEQAAAIMNLETILADLEKGGVSRDPKLYFVSIFGDPSSTGPWSWRFEGHHLSVNVTLNKGEVTSATPLVFGSNPAEIKAGPRKGTRTLPDIEELAKELIASFDETQTKAAKQAKQFPEIRERGSEAGVGEAAGIVTANLNDSQQKKLRTLIETYATRLPADIAATEMKNVNDTFNKVHFGYFIDDAKPGKPHTYRIQGSTFVIEFLNTQSDSARNPANHIHSGWRRLPKDFETK